MQTVSIGYDHVLVMKADGTLWGWGKNDYGQLGMGDQKARYSPVKILDQVVSMCAGAGNSFAVREDGSLWGWGTSIPGQSGEEDDCALTPIHLMDDVDSCTFAPMEVHGAILKKDHTLWTWGYVQEDCWENRKFSSKPLKMMEGVQKIQINDRQNLVLKQDGTIWMWGTNLCAGEIKNDIDPLRLITTPEKIEGLEEIRDVELGINLAGDILWNIRMALKKDGSVWCWGDSEFLGVEEIPRPLVPVNPINDAIAIASGPEYGAVIKSDHSLWMWGENTFGQLGNGRQGEKPDVQKEDQHICCYTPVKVMEQVSSVIANASHVLAIKDDHSLWGWGYNHYGQLGIGLQDIVTVERMSDDDYDYYCQVTPVKLMDDVAFAVTQGSMSEFYYETLDCMTIVVKSDGSLWTCGENKNGQIGKDTDGEPQVEFVKIMDGVKLPQKDD